LALAVDHSALRKRSRSQGQCHGPQQGTKMEQNFTEVQ
jgi:hypothetical protein